MFDHLRGFDTILVTGPQRSGTTIAARMIAMDLGLPLVLEEAFGVDDQRKFEAVVKAGGVIQCPGMCHLVHAVGQYAVAVVMMIRPLVDIHASEERIGWRREGHHLVEMRKYGTNSDIATAKYARWHGVQKSQIDHAFIIEYDTLAAHPLWIEKSKRASFGPRQTEL